MDRGTANERAWTWPQGRATALGSIARLPGLGEFAHWSAHGLRAAIAAETAPGRLVPWMPIAFGLGVVVYFAAERGHSIAPSGHIYPLKSLENGALTCIVVFLRLGTYIGQVLDMGIRHASNRPRYRT
jgi:hypothetical protein